MANPKSTPSPQKIMLSDLKVKSAKPQSKVYRLFDVGGLFLEVRPSGGKYFRVKFRFGGKDKFLTIGPYPKYSLKEARAQRDQARKLIDQGIDPCLQKKIKKISTSTGINTFEVVAREWHQKMLSEWTPGHGKTVLSRMTRDLFPWLGEREIGSITPSELLAVIKRTEERGAIETAHRELVICGQVFRYAVVSGRAARDITADLRGALKTYKSKPLAAITDPKRLGEVLVLIDGYKGGPVVRAAMRLAPLVFVRPGELRHARWEDIFWEEEEWRYLVTKTKTPHIVPLSRQALAILRDLHPLTAGKGNSTSKGTNQGWIFPSPRSSVKCMSENGVLAGLRNLGLSDDEICTHGFRATARTLLDEVLGYAPHLIEHQLAHSVKDPLGRAYNRTQHLQERKQMMQAWADYLDRLKGKG